MKCRNKDIENVIKIDLHEQHVKQGMKLLKLHLFFGAYVCCKLLFYRLVTIQVLDVLCYCYDFSSRSCLLCILLSCAILQGYHRTWESRSWKVKD